MRKHWSKLTPFLEKAGAPLDNNLCERALKKAILHRKNVLFYKTQNGAAVGDLFDEPDSHRRAPIGQLHRPRTGGAADLCTLAERTPLIGTLALELRRTPRPLRAGNDLRGGRAWVREQRRSWRFSNCPRSSAEDELLIGSRKISLKVELRPTRAPRALRAARRRRSLFFSASLNERSPRSVSSMTDIGAASPRRKPIFVIRV